MKFGGGMQKLSSRPPLLHSSLLMITSAVLANPPFNDSEGIRKDDDARWQFGVPFDAVLLFS